MLKLIKIIHTLIWVLMAMACFYILYAGLFNIFNVYLYTSLFLLSFETTALAVNKWVCPLTPMAMKYTDDRKDNFDIYLPLWLARHNKSIFGFIFMAGLLLVVFNWLRL